MRSFSTETHLGGEGDVHAGDPPLDPLPADIVINRLEVLHGDTEVTCIASHQIDIPALSTVTTRLYIIPNQEGDLRLSGVRVAAIPLWDVGASGEHLERRLLVRHEPDRQ